MPIFPASGGPNSGPGLNPVTIFVSPTGSDGNDGLTWSSAVRTGYVGYAKIVAAGGGYLNIAHGTRWGGPVGGQGAWFRGDQLTIDGWQPIVPCVITGFGPGAPESDFIRPGTAILYAGSNLPADFRTKPSSWSCYSFHHGITWNNIQMAPTPGYTDSEIGSYYAFRRGWDYPRANDGTRITHAISSSVRSGSFPNCSTVHTVALYDSGLSIASAVRASNVLTITPSAPGNLRAMPWKLGTWVWLAFTSDFTAQAYQIIDIPNAGVGADSNWSFSVASSGSDHSASNVGTIKSLVITDGDFVDLEVNVGTDDGKFPSTQYLVTSTAITNSTTGTVTVADPYGGYGAATTPYTNATSTPARVLVQQERGWNSVISHVDNNCASHTALSAESHNIYRAGPMYDYGGEFTFSPVNSNCYHEGYYPGADIATKPYDNFRMVSLVSRGYPGAPGAGSSITVRGSRGSNATVHASIQNAYGIVILDDIVFDGTNAPAAYLIDGSDSTYCQINNVIYSDANPGYGMSLNVISGIRGTNITGNSVTGAVNGSTLIDALVNVGGGSSPWEGGTSPWIPPMQIGVWGKDFRLNGRHPAAHRGISPAYARFAQIQTGPSSWADAPSSTGISDPMGGTGAVRYDDTRHSSVNNKTGTLIVQDQSGAYAAGDKIVIAGWYNYTQYDSDGLISMAVISGSMRFSDGSTSKTFPVPFIGQGWQFVVFSDKLSAGSGTSHFKVANWSAPFGSGGHGDWFGITSFIIPASITDNDAYEYIGTLKAQPYYLAAGKAGTFETQPFVAAGGVEIGQGGSTGLVTVYSAEIDFLAAPANNYLLSSLPAGFYFSPTTARFVITQINGTITTGPTLNCGNDPSKINVLGNGIQMTAGNLNTANTNGAPNPVPAAITTNLTLQKMYDTSNQFKMDITAAAVANTATVCKGRIELFGGLVPV